MKVSQCGEVTPPIQVPFQWSKCLLSQNNQVSPAASGVTDRVHKQQSSPLAILPPWQDRTSSPPLPLTQSRAQPWWTWSSLHKPEQRLRLLGLLKKWFSNSSHLLQQTLTAAGRQVLLLRLDLTWLPLSFTSYPPSAVAPPLSYLSHASSLYPKSSPLTVPSWFTSPSQGYIIKIGRDVGLIHPHLHFQDIAMLPLDIQQLVCKFQQFCLLHKTLHDILLVFSSHLQHFSWSIRWWTLLIPFNNSFHQYCHNSLKIYTTNHGANINKHIFNDTSVLDCCIWHNPNPTEHVFRQKVKFLNPAKCNTVSLSKWNLPKDLRSPKLAINETICLLDVYSTSLKHSQIGILNMKLGWGPWRPGIQRLSWGRFQGATMSITANA